MLEFITSITNDIYYFICDFPYLIKIYLYSYFSMEYILGQFIYQTCYQFLHDKEKIDFLIYWFYFSFFVFNKD